MARKRVEAQPEVTAGLLEQFKAKAAEWQEKSRCDCPVARRLNALIARKYLFYVLDHQHLVG